MEDNTLLKIIPTFLAWDSYKKAPGLFSYISVEVKLSNIVPKKQTLQKRPNNEYKLVQQNFRFRFFFSPRPLLIRFLTWLFVGNKPK